MASCVSARIGDFKMKGAIKLDENDKDDLATAIGALTELEFMQQARGLPPAVAISRRGLTSSFGNGMANGRANSSRRANPCPHRKNSWLGFLDTGQPSRKRTPSAESCRSGASLCARHSGVVVGQRWSRCPTYPAAPRASLASCRPAPYGLGLHPRKRALTPPRVAPFLV